MSSPFQARGPAPSSSVAAAIGGGSGGLLLFLPLPSPIALAGSWGWTAGWRWGRSNGGCRLVVAAAARPVVGGGEQDHYLVLGLPRSASTSDIKRSYRLLALKFHPDVNHDLQAGETFKSIRVAYEVLSDEVLRARYDMNLKCSETGKRMRRTRSGNPKYGERRRKHKWVDPRLEMRYEIHYREYTRYAQEDSYQESASCRRAPLVEVLRFSLVILLIMNTIGYRASLTVCGIMALLDKRLDIGYKMGYVVAWFMGGQGGILLALFLYISSWLCGKNSSSLVALVVIAMWLAVNLAKFAPLPQGAVLTLLYMSIKLQVDSK